MPTYHVNTEGNVAVCRASKNPCPFDSTLHGDNREDVQEWAGNYMEQRFEMEDFPRSWNPEFVKRQARLYWQEDQALGSGTNPYRRTRTAESPDELRFGDYLAGFKYGSLYENDGDVGLVEAEPGLEAATADAPGREEVDGKPLFDATAFQLGYARGLRHARPAPATGSMWLDHHIADYGIDAYKGADGKYDHVRFLANPFERGEEVLIPAKTPYSEGKELKYTALPQRVKVQNAQRSYVTGAVGRVLLHPAEITYAASKHGNLRTLILTPELLSANGKETYEALAVNSDIYLTPIYADIRQWRQAASPST